MDGGQPGPHHDPLPLGGLENGMLWSSLGLSLLERLQGRRQTLQKMKARVEQGFYVFKVPVGYRYEKSDGKGKVLVRNEPLASVVQEALCATPMDRIAKDPPPNVICYDFAKDGRDSSLIVRSAFSFGPAPKEVRMKFRRG